MRPLPDVSSPARLLVLCGLLLGLLLTLAAAPPARPQTPPPLVQRTLFGAFVGIDPDDPRRTVLDRPAALGEYEQRIGARVQILSTFHGVGDIFPTAVERQLAAAGSRALLASLDMGAQRAHRFSAWIRGDHDGYLRRLGRALADYPYPVYLRPWAEMNADWVPFQPTSDGRKPAGGTPGEFVQAWRHVVDAVRGAGATNVRWVFNPTADVYPETTSVARIFPGAAWVDVLAMDGYNWGTYPSWRSFRDIFTAQYGRLTALDPQLPVWLAEFASREPSINDGAPVDPSHSKASWLRAAFGSREFPRMQALVTFDIKKERDWRLASSSAALFAARQGLSQRPAPATRQGVAGLGVAGLPPTVRTTGQGDRILGWGRSLDPGTAAYQVLRQRAGRSTWEVLATTRAPQWTVGSASALAGLVRIRGVDAQGRLRWTGQPARLGAPPRPEVSLRSLSDGRLVVDVDPDIAGTGHWKGRLQVRRDGSWQTVQSFRTWGAGEVKRFTAGSGAYRVNIYAGQHQYGALYTQAHQHPG